MLDAYIIDIIERQRKEKERDDGQIPLRIGNDNIDNRRPPEATIQPTESDGRGCEEIADFLILRSRLTGFLDDSIN